MENEILHHILGETKEIKDGQQRADVRMDGLQKQIADMQRQVDDLRDTAMSVEQNMTKQFGAMHDANQIIMDMGREMLELARETRAMLDDHKSEQTAITATLMLHEQRIKHLEQQAV